jgi:sigma-B regulation protein RsbU (phosphoserine phosphatase)
MHIDGDNCLFFRRFSLSQPAINECRLVIKHVLLKISVSSDELDNTTLVVYEYLTNLLRHASGEGSQISIQLLQSGSGAYRLELTDKLTPFNPVKQYTDADFANDDLKLGGMGVSILQHHFPEAIYKSEGGLNTLILPLQGPSKRKRILCIDDDRNQLALLQAYLSSQYDVFCAEDLETGMEILYDTIPDILILDYELKECTAIAVLEKLNQTQLKCNMSIIILTGTTESNVESATSRLGIDRFLTKPVSKQQLDIAIEQLLYRSIVKGNQAKLIHYEEKQLLNIYTKCNVSFFGSINREHSGDFVYTISNEKKVVIVLSDVVGHGENASFQAAELKGFVSGYLQNPDNVTSLLPTLNQRFCDEQYSNKHFLTMLIVVITKDSVGVASAGHPLPIAIQQQSITELGQTGVMLGLDASQHYPFIYSSRPANQKLLLYTDGWFDNRYSALPATLCVKNYIQAMGNLAETDFSHALWQFSLPKASKEFDDASLVVIT